jgi:hypothetical protein
MPASCNEVQCQSWFVEQERVGQFVRQVAVLTCLGVTIVVDDHPAVAVKHSAGGECALVFGEEILGGVQGRGELAETHYGDVQMLCQLSRVKAVELAQAELGSHLER